jgi:hypothetical protein
MSGKRRRRPADPARTARRAAARAQATAPVVETAAPEAPPSEKPAASKPAPARSAARVQAPAAAPAGRPRPAWAGVASDDESHWSRWSLLVLLALTFAAQLVVGAITHIIGHRQRLLVVDLVFFQAPFVLAGAVLLMPLAKLITHQPRMLRLLEALSLGALFALFALLLTSVIVHPTVTSSASADQLIDQLKSNDALGIAVADLLAMLVSVQLFPGLQRILTAPGRRARRRLVEKRAQAPSRRPSPRDGRGRR